MDKTYKICNNGKIHAAVRKACNTNLDMFFGGTYVLKDNQLIVSFILPCSLMITFKEDDFSNPDFSKATKVLIENLPDEYKNKVLIQDYRWFQKNIPKNIREKTGYYSSVNDKYNID